MDFLIFIVAIGLVIIGIKGQSSIKRNSISEAREESYEIKNNLKLQGCLIAESYVKYCGGHPSLCDAKIYKINIYNDGIVLYNNKYTKGSLGSGIVIKKDELKKVNMIDQTQIINNPKFSSLLLFGVAGLGINNKDKSELYYLSLDYRYRDKDFTLMLSSDIEKDLGALFELVENTNNLSRMTKINSALNKVIAGEDSNSGMIKVL